MPDLGGLHNRGDAVRVRGLTKKFGKFTAVDGIDFSVKRGEIMGFLGPNGAGKTTTIKMMMGLLKISAGEVRIKGRSVHREMRRIKRFTGYMSQKYSLYPLLNSYQNIEFFGGVSGLPREAIRRSWREMEEIIAPELLRQKTSDIPPGIRQQVALHSCLMTDPDIIFLDEPTSGVDPENRRAFWMRIYELKKKGKTLLVTTHNLDEAEFADRIIILHHGRIASKGVLEELLAQNSLNSIEELFQRKVADHAED